MRLVSDLVLASVSYRVAASPPDVRYRLKNQEPGGFANKVEIPPTVVDGSFNYFLHGHQSHQLENPTNGSWWIVQIV
jgi:hypothetical protein